MIQTDSILSVTGNEASETLQPSLIPEESHLLHNQNPEITLELTAPTNHNTELRVPIALQSEIADTITMAETHTGIVLIPSKRGYDADHRPLTPFNNSWILLIMLVLFIVVSLRYKNNFRYLKTVFSNLTEARSRHNMFDDTVHETFFLFLLNIVCTVCCGILLFSALSLSQPQSVITTPLPLALACIAASAIYYLFQYSAFWICGNIFSDREHTLLWLKGFSLCQGLLGIVLFPVTICAIIFLEYIKIILITAAILFLIARILFICKGLRIFFTQFSSWTLFLYYLCNLEIVPFILTFGLAIKLSYIFA